MFHKSKCETAWHAEENGAIVRSIDIYNKDIVVKYEAVTRDRASKPDRGEIMEFSEKSRRKLAFYAQNTDVEFTHMITLTYPKKYPYDGRVVKGNLNRFLTFVRSRGVTSYLWFIEFQRRGAPHFHILVSDVGARLDRVSISERWYDAVNSGDVKHLLAGTRYERLRTSEGGARYATKYAQKMIQKAVPKKYRNVGRFWGCSKDVKPIPVFSSGEVDVSAGKFVQCMKMWDYYDSLDKRPLSTLYNASGEAYELIRGL